MLLAKQRLSAFVICSGVCQHVCLSDNHFGFIVQSSALFLYMHAQFGILVSPKIVSKYRACSKVSKKLKIKNITCIICCHLLKCPIVKWFYGPRIHTNFHLAKLSLTDEISSRVVYQRTFRLF